MDLANLDTTWLIVGLLVLAVLAFSLALAGWRRSKRRQQDAIPPAFSPTPDLDSLGLSAARPVTAPLPTPPSEREPVTPRVDDEPSGPDPIEEALDDEPSGYDPHDDGALDHAGDDPAPDGDSDDDTAWMPPPDGLERVDGAEDDSTPDDDFSDTPDTPETDDDVMDDLEMETDVPVTFDDAGVSAPRPVMKPPPARTRPHPHLTESSPLWHHVEPEAVGSLLESLWAALGAQSTALLRYDARREVFAVEGLMSRDGSLHTDPFPARNNALLPLMEDESALAVLEGEALASLRYHTSPRAAVGHAVALALPGTSGLVLIADGAQADLAFTRRQVNLFGDYADLFGRLFHTVSLNLPSETPAPDGTGEAPPQRTRADIIAEEMEAARAHERPLALALVVPKNSEDIAAEGPEAIAQVEAQLLERLRAVDGSARVEHFGENMMGVFCHAGPAFVEAWAERVSATGPPVFIGVALLRARHGDAEALRNAAAAALYEAYESGKACVILE